MSDAQGLHEHVLRLNHDSEGNGTSINCMKISFDHEYPFQCISYRTVIVNAIIIKVQFNCLFQGTHGLFK